MATFLDKVKPENTQDDYFVILCKPLTYDEIQCIIDVADPYSILATSAWLLIMDRHLVKPSFALSSPTCLLAVRWGLLAQLKLDAASRLLAL